MEYVYDIIKLIVKVGLAYVACLLFTVEFNPLLWSNLAKFMLIVVILLSND